MRKFLGKLDSLLQDGCIIVTVEQETVGIMVIQEEHQLEVFGILGEVSLDLALERGIALDAVTSMDLFQQEIAIGEVQHAIQRTYIIGL